MPHRAHKTLILMITLIASTTLAAHISANAYAQQEITPTHTFETQDEYVKLALSANGNYIAAISNETDTLAVFNRTNMLWSASVTGVHSVAVSENASLIAAAATSGLYIFSLKSPTPQTHYNVVFMNPLIALSNDGSTLALAEQNSDTSTRLLLFEPPNQNSTWTTTIQGTLESISTSSNGTYITASTSHPGTLHLFSKQQPTPSWTYSFGEQCTGAHLSQNGEYIIAVGGNQTDTYSMRIQRFRTTNASPNYVKLISELPSAQGMTVSSNGSIFAITYAKSNRLIFFNLDLPPYGYGPGSVLNVSLPARSVATSMSNDGRHIAVGTEEGIYTYEYLNKQLTLAKQYTVDRPFIFDIALSANGSYLAAAATKSQQQPDSKEPAIYIFDLQETRDSFTNLWLQTAFLIVIVFVVVTAVVLIRRRKQKPQKPSDTTKAVN